MHLISQLNDLCPAVECIIGSVSMATSGLNFIKLFISCGLSYNISLFKGVVCMYVCVYMHGM